MEQELIKQMLDKSQEAFLMAIEIYNKPTIKYRLEGFAFFMCNAWELLLKAYLISKGDVKEIYYKDKLNRTISLSECIKKTFANDKDPIRKNFKIIVDLKNNEDYFYYYSIAKRYTCSQKLVGFVTAIILK